MHQNADTPMMRQYYHLKQKYPDALLLFRVGDFYETFSEDAVKASEVLGIALASRGSGSASAVKLAGFPHHALDTYLPKLVRAGLRVAVCDQLEDPKMAKGLVKRGITELVTPGVVTQENVLSNKENNFLAAIHFGTQIGAAFLDLSTGEYFITEGDETYIDTLLNNYSPKEILYQKGKEEVFTRHFGVKFYTYKLDDWAFTESTAYDKLIDHFNVQTLKGFGIQELKQGIVAASVILTYLGLTQHKQLDHIVKISRIDLDDNIWLDRFTVKNLEILNSNNEGGKSLLETIDYTLSPMGSRLLRRWLLFPLVNISSILERQTVVSFLLQNEVQADQLSSLISQIGDLERLTQRIATKKALPREIVQLARTLEVIDKTKQFCLSESQNELNKKGDLLNSCTLIKDHIITYLNPEPAVQIGKGDVIARGVNENLDELRDITKHSKQYLQELQDREIRQTGISSLKIGYTNVFGYYLEVRNSHKDKVPETWIRKQTLAGAERYITEELKSYETKILTSTARIIEIEQNLFANLLNELSGYISALQVNAQIIAQLDCLLSFAKLAKKRNYCCPVLDSTLKLTITNGRHPVIESILPLGESYIPNSVNLDNKNTQVIILTGPNMGGKSAFLRQTALITLLAQIGSFVPADSAKIGIVDKIFTRVGASDNLSQGESTFMVEMQEAASILHNISERSLILLDEIGRGTSTYDGISIAWSMVEYLHRHATQPKTIFATHYHELNELSKSCERVKNYNITVKEIDSKILFLRQIKEGHAEHSFGIHVAQMAGMPQSVINRSKEILTTFEELRPIKNKISSSNKKKPMQLSLFNIEDEVLSEIRNELLQIDVNNLTPIEALNKLSHLKVILKR